MSKIRVVLERLIKLCDSPKRMKELTGKYPIEEAEEELKKLINKRIDDALPGDLGDEIKDVIWGE